MIGLILTLALIGFVLWLILTYIPMPAPFKTIICVIVAVFLIVYLMRILGVVDVPVPRLR